jgi:hypothetical protein
MRFTGPRHCRLAIATLSVIALAGCGGGEQATSTTTSTTAPVVSSTTTVVAVTSTSSVATTATPKTVAVGPTKPVVTLQAGGLVFNLDGAAISRTFTSTSRADVRSALVRAFGDPVKEEDQECGSGPVHSMRWSAITAYTANGSFVGWFVGPGATPKLSTTDGIALGTTLAQLRKVQPSVKVTKTSLGDEWSVGTDLGGTLTSSSSTGTINAIFSGDACIAR